MDWQAIGPHKDGVIWVRELRAGCWAAAVTPGPAPPASMPGIPSASGEMVLPEGFASQAAAVEAARRYLNRDQERRLEAEESPGGDTRPQPARRAAMRRQFSRIPVSLPVIGQASQFGGTLLPGTVRSVGPGGLMVEFPVVVVRGSSLRVTVKTGLGPLELEGRVVWTAVSRDTICHGLAFPAPKGPDFAAELGIAKSRSEGGGWL